MDIKQVYELVNQTSGEVLGRTDILKDDLTGVVQLGDEVFNQGANGANNANFARQQRAPQQEEKLPEIDLDKEDV